MVLYENSLKFKQKKNTTKIEEKRNRNFMKISKEIAQFFTKKNQIREQN